MRSAFLLKEKSERENMEQTVAFLENQNIDKNLIRGVEEFRNRNFVEEEEKRRIVKPDMAFYGKEVLEMAIAALLEGENLLLTGAKADGKERAGRESGHGFSDVGL